MMVNVRIVVFKQSLGQNDLFWRAYLYIYIYIYIYIYTSIYIVSVCMYVCMNLFNISLNNILVDEM